MGINIVKRKLSELSTDILLRIDGKFHLVFKDFEWDIFHTGSDNLVFLKEYLVPYYENFNYEDGVQYKGIPTGREYIDEFGFITDYQEVTKEEHPGRLKYKVDNDCILISSLKGAITPALNFDFDLNDYVFSNGFYIFKPKVGNNKKFLLYLLRSKRIKYLLDNVIYRGIGISAYREDDLLHLKIPKISKLKQDEVVKKIDPIEKDINTLRGTKKDDLSIINEVFGDEFGFDWNKFKKLKSEKIFNSSLSEFSNNIDCRFAFRFQHPSGKYMMNFLMSHTVKKIKDYLEVPISLGASISPSQYDENGEYYYISMATVKNYYFDKNDAKKVSLMYSQNNQHKTVKKDDIIMTRSGMAIGKFALIEDADIQGIYADFTMRIRLKNYNQRLAYYYFRSDFFQHLITTNKKGLQNHNIFPSQIQEFPIPDWSMTKQNEIVEKIKSQIDTQRAIDSEIKKKQDEISLLIEEAIKEGNK